MICFRDTTYCTNPNCTCPEGIRLTEEVIQAAREWWGSEGASIGMANRCGGLEP